MVTVRERGRRNSRDTEGAERPRQIVRHRDKRVEAFDASTRVPIENAYFDLIRISLHAYTFFFDKHSEYVAFRQQFSRRGITRASDVNYHEPRILECWLFSGTVKFVRTGSDADEANEDGHKVKVYYHLNLNPSRFVHHAFFKLQGDHENFNLEALQEIETASLLQKEEISNSEDRSLDNNDNYIPEMVFKVVRPFDQYVQFYIETVIEFLNHNIWDSLVASRGREPVGEREAVECQDGLTVHACEVYWEYSAIDALSFVNALWDGFQAVLYETEKRTFYTRDILDAEPNEAPVGRIQGLNGIALYANDFGTAGLKLVTYAKLENRVRFELRYNRGLRRIFNSRFSNALGTNLPSLFLMLREYRRISQKRLFKMVRALPDLALTERAQYHEFIDFLVLLGDIHRDFPSHSVRQTLSLLINLGRMTAVRGGDDHRLLERMKADYIITEQTAYLRNDGDAVIYSLLPRYRNVVNAFGEIFENSEL